MIQTSSLPDLAAVNHMDRGTFVEVLGHAFEHSPWVAETAWTKRPFISVEALHGAMMDVVEQAPRETQVSFLCGHPELAGKEAQAGTMTSESVGEQASAGLDALSRDEMVELRDLNRRYRERHGFPFIIAVRQYSKSQIFQQLVARIDLDSDLELQEALRQIAWISSVRVKEKLTA
ncbi:MAG: 2-oxo-4-hydroxy-4-carboxy-5-ureidoimidazoline decarboxylase [Pseudomonas sp.]|uniref:2-oxo-4-hydroxy-4-carboxy-5-ureidoimidazoline decarboxylase n=1 Tax=Pseudomonas sp. TaxID=306 RepID=UPI00121BF501|nr:2-oxo-4-hydroxy-4-carboxy-5-ureidoimidazoline decarboxylase [Pseudomonas sp.]RZI76780.1 MAG: 2-oxo-4-hydroxy-4-carboxy-5-ureidoimidazoline decarboxylase [Pseudomonas sp.]